MTWKIIAASAQGTSHIDIGLPCQDEHKFEIKGSRFVAVVCDGAGSAAQSQRGATMCCEGVVAQLAAMLGDNESLPTLDTIVAAVERVRGEIVAVATMEPLSLDQFACTLVGVVAGAAGGVLFHIGDGVGIVEFAEENRERFVSKPENGEYANETYFITDESWREHLRCAEFSGSVRCIGLMSDGAMPFVVNRQLNDFVRPFIDPVTRYLLSNDDVTGTEALKNTLSSEGTWAITGDDKTLLLAYPQTD